MPDKTKQSVDVAETLEELHQITEVTELDTSGKDAGPLGQVHPLGWVAIALLIGAVIFHLMDTQWLLGNFSWWHWVGLIAIALLSLRPEPIKLVSRIIDSVMNFLEQGVGTFAHPWAAFVSAVVGLATFGLAIGPLRGLADWIFGVEVTDVGGGDFEVVSSGLRGWITSAIAALVLVAVLVGIYRALSGSMPEGDIPIPTGAMLGVATFFITLLIVGLASSWSTGITTGFAVGVLVAAVALGPLWTLGWGIFVTIFFYVVSRYTARYIEADIIIGEVNSLGINLFGFLALLGVGYGVKAGVNPRIDFWWADFSNRTKAWLDFVIHVLLLMPFLWAALRLLHGYAKTNLGYKTDFTGETDGSWPASWHVWETWSQAPDFGNLPTGPLRAMIFVGFVLFFCQVLSETIKSGFVLIRREDLGELKQNLAPARIE